MLRSIEHIELKVSFGVQRHELADAEECPRSLKFGMESFHLFGETPSVANEYRGYDLPVRAGRNGHPAQCSTKRQAAFSFLRFSTDRDCLFCACSQALDLF